MILARRLWLARRRKASLGAGVRRGDMVETSDNRSLQGEPPPGASHPAGGLAASWEAFCDGLRAAGRETLAAAPGELDAAEGLAQFGQLLEVALRWYLRGADPDVPRFIEINDTPEVADNLFAAVRGDAVYRVTGDASTLFDFNISVHSSWAWLKPSRPTGDVGRDELSVGPKGVVELVLGGEPRQGNWLPLPADAAFIQLREYHADFESHRPGSWSIERIDGPATAPGRPTPAEVTARLTGALSWAQRYSSFHRAALNVTFPEAANTMRPPASNPGGNRHIWYGFGRFALGDDEALVLEFEKPDARLWSVQWLLDPWYENPDLINRSTGITGAEAHLGADGRVRVVFAARDPGVPNWLDVGGYPRGLFVTRWIWCEHGPPTMLSVVSLSDLRGRLPADTPVVSPGQRAAQRLRRRTHFVHRRR